MKKFIAISLLTLLPLSSQAASKSLHIYNWSDYIAPDTISNFEKQTGIKTIYDVFDSNEVLEGKLMAGSTGFDIVVPTDSYLARQIDAGIYQPLDKSKLSNYHHLDPKLMQMMQVHDPDNRYGIPYMYQSTGIGYNINKVKQIMGADFKMDSWSALFKVENLKKLSQCGVAFLDAPGEMFPTVLNYLGKDPNSSNAKDYRAAEQLLEKLRPYITYFHNSKYINDLSGGDICVAIGWSGDVLQAANAAKEAHNGVNIGYSVPKEGAVITFDVFAIPKDAPNVDSAYQFLNYMLEPKVIASVSNRVFYPSANKDALPYVDQAIANNPGVYPPPAIIERLFPIKKQTPKVDRMMTRLWVKILTGQ